jgi:diketogulonate reductase-like aldo/keto reductase
MEACDNTLKDLQLSYLDLYLIHWPITQDPITKMNRIDLDQLKKTWKDMERLVECGKAKSIGVSNFTIGLLKELLPTCKIKPAVNQVELHPYLPQQELVDFCKQNGIALTAYSPLGSRPGQNSVLDDPVIAKIAQKNSKTPAQVLISWAVQRGTVVIPKSRNADRIKSNFELFEISDEDFASINQLGVKNTRYVDPKTWANVDLFGLY